MQELIQAYEKSRALVLRRVQELTAQLRNGHLRNKERDALCARRALLWEESADLTRILRTLYAHIEEADTHEGKSGSRPDGVRQGVSCGDQRRKQHKPGTPQHCMPGAEASDPDRPDTTAERGTAAVLSGGDENVSDRRPAQQRPVHDLPHHHPGKGSAQEKSALLHGVSQL